MFDDAKQALNHAYRSETKDTTVVSQFINDLRGGSIKEITGLTRWDHLAQAAMTMHSARRDLSYNEKEMMTAYFTVPIKDLSGLVGRKELACKMISFHVYEKFGRKFDRWFCNDIVRGYCGLRRQHTDKWWADHLCVTDRQIRNRKLGIKGRGTPGLFTECDNLYDRMIREAADKLFNADIIKYNA